MKCLSDRAALDQAYQRVAASNWFILGREGEALKKNLPVFVVPSTLSASQTVLKPFNLLLIASGIGPGDEVVVAAKFTVYRHLDGCFTGRCPAHTG